MEKTLELVFKLFNTKCSLTVLSNKVRYKRFDTKSSLCCSCLFVCSAAFGWCCFSVLKRWKGLKMLLLLNLGFLWVKNKYTCLFIPGLSSNNGLSWYDFFFLLEFNFFHVDFRILDFLAPLGSKLQALSFTIHFVLGQKMLGGIHLSWTSGCRCLQEETSFAVSLRMY